MNQKFFMKILFSLKTCEHIEPGMELFVISDDEAREEDDHDNDCAHHEANHPIITLNEGHIAR